MITEETVAVAESSGIGYLRDDVPFEPSEDHHDDYLRLLYDTVEWVVDGKTGDRCKTVTLDDLKSLKEDIKKRNPPYKKHALSAVQLLIEVFEGARPPWNIMIAETAGIEWPLNQSHFSDQEQISNLSHGNTATPIYDLSWCNTPEGSDSEYASTAALILGVVSIAAKISSSDIVIATFPSSSIRF